MGTIYLGEFSIVLHDPIHDLTLLQWRLKFPKRREVSVHSFFCNVHILLWWGNGMGTIYLGEFSIVLHDPILDLTLLRWRLKVPKRREATAQPFFRNVHILLWWGNGIRTIYLGEFSIVLHDPILDLTLLHWCLKVPKRREASVQLFFCNVHILLYLW
jgi:hypothetical protein